MRQKIVRYFGLQNKPSPGATRVFAVVRRYSQVLPPPPIFAAKKQKNAGVKLSTLRKRSLRRLSADYKQALVRD